MQSSGSDVDNDSIEDGNGNGKGRKGRKESPDSAERRKARSTALAQDPLAPSLVGH